MRTVVAGLLLLGVVTSVAVTPPGTPEARSHTARADVPAMVTRVLPAVVSVTIRIPLPVFTSCFCPVPLHSEHFVGVVPGFAPLPRQVSHFSDRVMWMIRSPPFAASSNARSRS